MFRPISAGILPHSPFVGQTNVMIALSDRSGTAACAAGGCRYGLDHWVAVVPSRVPRWPMLLAGALAVQATPNAIRGQC